MTIRDTRNDGIEVLFDALLGGSAAGHFERQEARGQQELCASTQLPQKGSESEEIQALGIEWGESAKGDELFREATLPEGWEKRATDHSMWSEIVDETGKVRAEVFYKAAFYDRDAFIRATCDEDEEVS